MKLFRKTRQKLASENLPDRQAGKVMAYLRYAVGEIILVVIGILIALQVNNWKENIQNNELEKNTLENIRSDLVLQQDIINGQLQFEESKIAKADTAAMFLSSSLSLGKLNALLENLSERRTFVANKTSYINMDRNGDKNLIQNAKLQNAIVRYYQQLDYVTQVINNNNLFIIDGQFGPFVSNNSLNIKLARNGLIDNKQKIAPGKKLQLRNQLQMRKVVSENIHRLCLEQLDAIRHLIQLIDKELK